MGFGVGIWSWGWHWDLGLRLGLSFGIGTPLPPPSPPFSPCSPSALPPIPPFSSHPMDADDSVPVTSWLAALHLDQYSAAFLQRRLRTVADCRLLAEADLSQLGVRLPGHRRRILLGLRKALPPPPPPPDPPGTKPIPAPRRVFLSPPLPSMDPPVPSSSPPPVPPRLGCRPPLIFAPSSPSGRPTECGVAPPLLAPPLPVKRHHEGKAGTPESPPVLPPRCGAREEGGR